MYISQSAHGFRQYINKQEDNTFTTSFVHQYGNSINSYRIDFEFNSDIVYGPEVENYDYEIKFSGNGNMMI